MSEGAIAIVGAACRFPGAAGLEAFWRLLIDGIDAVSEIGPDRWSTRFFHHPKPGEAGKSYNWAAGLIDGVDLFEPGFFGISPREAGEMDPQQRLLLELAWHALEDAGIPAARLAGGRTGVYVGASSTDYGDLRLGDVASGGPHFVSGMTLSILANRLSHVFDLRGPSQVIDTACSSSLVALHAACGALRAGEIETALVGGVNLLLSPYPFIGFAQAGMLSRRGRCFAFDARADGYARGEGGAAILLKPLARARADNDPIRGVIRGTAVNASGRTIGLSLPSATAQAELLRGVYARSGIAPDALAFVEMHGTGTPAGDPAEAEAVGGVLGRARLAPLPIGSVKTNIGHLEPASGLAGLLKAMLALERGVLPRSLHGEMPNPAIPFDRLNLRLAGAAEPLAGAFAGVNSFGFGGVNGHAILEAPPPRDKPETEISLHPPLLISARGKVALRALAQEWRDRLTTAPPARRRLLARAAARRRDQHPERLVVLGGDPAAVLDDFLADRANPAAVAGEAAREGRLAFVYSGNGAQFPGMGQAVYRASAAFREAVEAAEIALRPYLGWSVGERISGGVESEEMRRADIAQPMLFAIQVAITTVLRGMGVEPRGFVGHSVGEIAAAWAAGALSLDEAARIVATRSRMQEWMRGRGRMAVLALGADAAAALLCESAAGVEIAAINSARSVTVAGTAEDIRRLGEVAADRGLAWRQLDLDFAFHSALMEPIRGYLMAELAGVRSAAPSDDLVSTVTGAPVVADALDAAHWWRNVREPVRFAAAIDRLVAEGYRIFAEIGPTPVVLTYLRDALKAAPSGRAVATLGRRDTASDVFPGIAARLHVAGHDMSGGAWLDGPDDPRGLPLYPWQRERFWFDRTVERTEQINPIRDHPLLGFRQDGPAMSWVNHLDTTLFPLLADHRVDGGPVLPAAAIIDMALAAARAHCPDALALELREIELLRPVAFDDGTREMRCTLLPDGTWQLTSRRRLSDKPLIVHATARAATAAPSWIPRSTSDCGAGTAMPAEALYQRAARLGLDYGESFRTVEKVLLLGDDRAIARLRPKPRGEEWVIDPALLDGGLQALLALRGNDADEASFLPRRFGRVTAFAPLGRIAARAELRLTRRSARSIVADIVLSDAAGHAVAELAGCQFARVATRDTLSQPLLHTALVPAPLVPMPVAILDRVGEIVPRVATARSRDHERETEQTLLFEALLASLAREAGADAAEPLRRMARRFADEDLPEADKLWRLLLADHPEMVAELTLVAMLREGLPVAPASPAVAALRRNSPPAFAGRAILAAVLDEIAAAWPADRPLRVSENGATRLSDRLRHGRIEVIRVAEGEPCDLALSAEIGALDTSGISLLPEGILLALIPQPNPLWELIGESFDWRAELAVSGLADTGAIPVSQGPWPCELIWARMPAEAPSQWSKAALSLELAGDAGHELAAALSAYGHRRAEPGEQPDGIVFAAGDGDPAMLTGLLPQFARIAASAADRGVPFWLVTSGGHQPSRDRGVGSAALWGFGRVLRNEVPGLVLRMVDLPAEVAGADRARCLAAELGAAGRETEIVWTAHGRHVPRVRRGAPPRRAVPGDAVVASLSPPGGLDRIHWIPASPRAPGAGEVAIEVRAAGLNFRDVMAATGALPEEALLDGFAGAALGLECAGVVTAVGDGVEAFAVGDRVVGFAPAALASHVVTSAEALIAVPPGLDFTAAATLPVAFVTARYSLVTLARLRPGETVLIHAASGGVGLAAIQVAKACGATVIATAGSPEKRAFLRMVGADHIADSRELRFAPVVREVTGGTGVDVVLNALSGEAMEASIDLLKPFGRFVELGKRDIYENRAIRARPLRQNISFFVVDVDQLPLRRPELAKSLLSEIAKALAAGEIRPLAHRCFAFAEITEAFRLMRAARHIGKLILVPDRNAGIALSPVADLAIRRDGAYVVTGGLDGFGFATARWLAEHGAGHLALIGRRGLDTPGAAERIAELEALGARISVHAGDVTDTGQLGIALDALRHSGSPIRGVVHAAGVIVDGMAATLTRDQIATALSGKLRGARNLDRLTRGDPLDFFWLFSSAATVIGAPGQGAYVAANAALEALARRRQGEGLPALAIAWGPIADAGTLAGRPDQRAALTRRLGARPMTAARALASLPAMAASGLPVVALTDIAWHEMHATLPIVAEPLFAELGEGASDLGPDEALTDQLLALDPAERCGRLAAIIAAEAARILRMPGNAVDPHRPLTELGMDSLMAMELRLALERSLRVDVPLMSLAGGASATGLATDLAARLGRPAREASIIELAAQHRTLSELDLAADE